MIVADVGKKLSEIILYKGDLTEAIQQASRYARNERFLIKRLARTDLGEFWVNVEVIGDYNT